MQGKLVVAGFALALASLCGVDGALGGRPVARGDGRVPAPVRREREVRKAPEQPPQPKGHMVARELNLRNGLLRQYSRLMESRPHPLTLMCVGETGVGKSSLIANLFTVPIIKGPPSRTEKIVHHELTIDGDGVPLTLNFIDTPGYGDELDVKTTFRRIVNDIERISAETFEREEAAERQTPGPFRSFGVDAVLYFIAPHRFKNIDIQFLKSIQGKVNIIPILAKADTMTSDELIAFRSLVTTKLAEAKITYFRGPFAVISSPLSDAPPNPAAAAAPPPAPQPSPERRYGSTLQSPPRSPSIMGGKAGRYYPWGTAESENEDHSDLRALRRMLVTDGLLDLRAATQRNFEGYRRRRLLWRTGWRGALRNFAITAAQAAAVAMLVQEVAPRVDAGAVVQEAVDMVLDRYEDAKERVLGFARDRDRVDKNLPDVEWGGGR